MQHSFLNFSLIYEPLVAIAVFKLRRILRPLFLGKSLSTVFYFSIVLFRRAATFGHVVPDTMDST